MALGRMWWGVPGEEEPWACAVVWGVEGMYVTIWLAIEAFLTLEPNTNKPLRSAQYIYIYKQNKLCPLAQACGLGRALGKP